jgi:hypothetical protein
VGNKDYPTSIGLHFTSKEYANCYYINKKLRQSGHTPSSWLVPDIQYGSLFYTTQLAHMVNTIRLDLSAELPKAEIIPVMEDNDTNARSMVDNNLIRFEEGRLRGTVELCEAGLLENKLPQVVYEL